MALNDWTPETATSPPDLSAMPLWVDLRGVPNGLFSHKGLKCLSRAVGKFVKLHPTRERCTSLDVAHVLVEVDLHQPLLERIVFTDKQGQQREISSPFLGVRSVVLCVRAGDIGVQNAGTKLFVS